MASALLYFDAKCLAVGLLMLVKKNYLHSFILMQAGLILTPKVRHKSNFDIRLTLNVTGCYVLIDRVKSFCSKN